MKVEYEITYDLFKSIMNRAVAQINLSDNLFKAQNQYEAEAKDCCEINYPTNFGDVYLLEDMIGVELLTWWLFELDCGRNYHDGCLTYKDNPVPCKTIEELWIAVEIFTQPD